MNRREFLGAGMLAGAALTSMPLAMAADNWDDTDAPTAPAPKYATVLFDGKSLSAWLSRKGGPPGWKIENGYAEVVPKSGDIRTKDTFEDYQLHVEFWLPYMPNAKGQARANSGVYQQGRYEVQVLDSYGLEAQDNDCGAIYKVSKPLRNACKKPERWQTYDIAFRAPRFDASGRMTEKARITVFQNSILIQNSQEVDHPTGGELDSDLSKPGPVMLQDHGNTVRFRNVWIVPI